MSPAANPLQSIYTGCRVPLLSEVDAWLAKGARCNHEHALSHAELLATLPHTVVPCPEYDEQLHMVLEHSVPNSPVSQRHSRISDALTADTGLLTNVSGCDFSRQ